MLTMDARQSRILGLALLFLAAAGCKSPLPDLSGSLPWIGDDKEEEPIYEQPAKIVVIWSPAMYTQPGQTPTRGFGGRIYFYNSKERAIPVEGQLVVYAFDDTQRQAARSAPDKRFVFPAEQFTKHFAPTELGASYSIWVPWDPVGSPQMDISLLPIFTGKNGAVVTGQQSRNLLPGPETQKPEPRSQQIVLPAGHQAPPANANIIAHTIGLPQATSERIAASKEFPMAAQQPAPSGPIHREQSSSNQQTGYVAPTTESRSWGPVVPRRTYRPAERQARSSPSTPPARAEQPLPQAAGHLPMPPFPAGQPYPPRAGLQSGLPSSGQVIYRDVSETAP